jgi:hypothetical protein
VAAAAVSTGHALGSAGADHPAPLRADIDGEEYPQRGDPTAFARQLIETLDTLTPKERLAATSRNRSRYGPRRIRGAPRSRRNS